MHISTKLQSDKKIRSLGVNYVEFYLVTTIQEAISALTKLEEPIAIREKRQGGGKFIFGMTYNEAKAYIQSNKITFPYAVYTDMEKYEQSLLQQGSIQLFPDGGLHATYCTVPGIKNREAMIHPKAIEIVDWSQFPVADKWDWRAGWNYKPLRYIIDYLCMYHIVGPVIEYTLYATNVGINNEPIVIWEIRNY